MAACCAVARNSDRESITTVSGVFGDFVAVVLLGLCTTVEDSSRIVGSALQLVSLDSVCNHMMYMCIIESVQS